MPRAMARRSQRGVPTTSVLTITAFGAAGLLVTFLADWGTEDLVALPAALILVTYLVGTAAGVRILSGRSRAVAAVAFVLTLAIAPFAAAYSLAPILVAAAALLYHRTGRRRRRAMGDSSRA